MKFYIAEKNIGPDATRKEVDQLIARLITKGWDVAYGHQENQLTDPAEKREEQNIMDRFANDFMGCLKEMDN
jgi:hypothetical protein